MRDLEGGARLYATTQEREQYETMATLFGLITCLDHLERAYIRGAVHDDAYTPACARLLAQYKTVLTLLTSATQPRAFHVASVDAFMKEYEVRVAR